MRYTLTKEFRFEASHRLPHHDGKCARLHGHSWRMVVAVEGDGLLADGAKEGMLLDYAVMKAVVDPLVADHLDHWHLNESLSMESPTSERVAAWAFGWLEGRIKVASKGAARLAWVEISETCTTGCRYNPPPP